MRRLVLVTQVAAGITLLGTLACQDHATAPFSSGNNGAGSDVRDVEGFASRGELRSGYIRGRNGEWRRITYEVQGPYAIMEGDIILGLADKIATSPTSGHADPGLAWGIAIDGPSSRWAGGIVPYEIDPSLPNQARVVNAIAQVEATTAGVDLVPRSGQTNYIRFVPSDGCASYIGQIGGMQPIMLADGCGTGAATHEIAHALGMFHEQSRCDRDTYVEILWANILPGYEHNFDKFCDGATDFFDYAEESLMHYYPYAFSANGQPTIRSLRGLDHLMGQRGDLGPTDMATIDALYPNQTPAASITSPTGNVTIQAGQSVSFDGSGADADGTVASYAWTFAGGTPSSSSAQNPGTVTYASAGTYTARLTVTDNLGAEDPTPATRTITVQATSNALVVSVTEAAFTPQSAKSAQGRAVRWNFQGPGTHSATDRSGMGLFASGAKGAGTSYSFTFVGAGTYQYRCTQHPTVHSGNVKVPVLISPATGRRTTNFTVTWASATAPTGYVYDVQVKRPGATAFVNWKTGQTARSSAFVPDAGTGTYQFRARLRKPAVAKASGYSAAKSISVTS